MEPQPICCWTMFFKFWRKKHPKVCITKPNADICDECYIFYNRRKLGPKPTETSENDTETEVQQAAGDSGDTEIETQRATTVDHDITEATVQQAATVQQSVTVNHDIAEAAVQQVATVQQAVTVNHDIAEAANKNRSDKARKRRKRTTTTVAL